MTTWKDPKEHPPLQCERYWVADSKNKTQVGRLYQNTGWVDENYSKIKGVVLYCEIVAPKLPK